MAGRAGVALAFPDAQSLFWNDGSLAGALPRAFSPTGDDFAFLDALVAALVADGTADQAVVCCWTGTGASIAANKVAGVRAALCTDAETARGRVALIGGTSSCHMAVSPEPRFVPGVWGPYFSAMVPGWWLNEGGQSATGALLDHVVGTHPARVEAAAAWSAACAAGGALERYMSRRLGASRAASGKGQAAA